MQNELTNTTLPLAHTATLTAAGQVANHYANAGVFADYLRRKSAHTVKAQAQDLTSFAEYLNAAGVTIDPEQLQTLPGAWTGITWGLVAAYVKWLLQEGYAVGTINRRLSTIKTYAKLAQQAGALADSDLTSIRTVTGFGHKERKRINERRPVTRRGEKKSTPVELSDEQAQALKDQPDTPQGRRDRLLMCLLLDHGLRAGEVAALEVTNFDMKKGIMRFDRPKVSLEQNHKLTADTLLALRAWFESGDCPALGLLLRNSRKGGHLTTAGMNEIRISERVRTLGEKIEVNGLSAHDCRHYWASRWAGKVDVLRLQEAGGWSSLEMPRRYVKRAEIANEGMA